MCMYFTFRTWNGEYWVEKGGKGFFRVVSWIGNTKHFVSKRLIFLTLLSEGSVERLLVLFRMNQCWCRWTRMDKERFLLLKIHLSKNCLLRQVHFKALLLAILPQPSMSNFSFVFWRKIVCLICPWHYLDSST